MAALGAASRKHSAPVLGAHANPESVCFGPFAVVGLKCTFWHSSSDGRRDPKQSNFQYTTKNSRIQESKNSEFVAFTAGARGGCAVACGGGKTF